MTPLRFRAGSKLGVTFFVAHNQDINVARNARGVEGVITEWRRVGIKSIVKDHWQDKSGRWRDSVYFYEIEPGPDENRVELDEYYVRGCFQIVRHEKDMSRALAAWKDFKAE